jgi:hypothetical protein
MSRILGISRDEKKRVVVGLGDDEKVDELRRVEEEGVNDVTWIERCRMEEVEHARSATRRDCASDDNMTGFVCD